MVQVKYYANGPRQHDLLVLEASCGWCTSAAWVPFCLPALEVTLRLENVEQVSMVTSWHFRIHRGGFIKGFPPRRVWVTSQRGASVSAGKFVPAAFSKGRKRGEWTRVRTEWDEKQRNGSENIWPEATHHTSWYSECVFFLVFSNMHNFS